MNGARIFTNLDTRVALRLDTPLAAVALYSREAPDKRGGNEDAMVVIEHADDLLIAAIADGAGGYAAGARASAIAVETLAEQLGVLGELPARVAILNAFEQAHAAIRDTATGAATTFAVAELAGGRVRTYHAGDSGILVVGGRGRVKHKTLFHSPTGYGVEAGLIDAEAALHHAERHIVSNLLGREPMSVEIGSALKLAQRDTVVMASDGLFDNLYIEEIAGIARQWPIERACQDLADAARERMLAAPAGAPSKADDLTVMMLRPRR